MSLRLQEAAHTQARAREGHNSKHESLSARPPLKNGRLCRGLGDREWAWQRLSSRGCGRMR
eukprot:3555052-Pleurochrysis_carterae.AAC.4